MIQQPKTSPPSFYDHSGGLITTNPLPPEDDRLTALVINDHCRVAREQQIPAYSGWDDHDYLLFRSSWCLRLEAAFSVVVVLCVRHLGDFPLSSSKLQPTPHPHHGILQIVVFYRFGECIARDYEACLGTAITVESQYTILHTILPRCIVPTSDMYMLLSERSRKETSSLRLFQRQQFVIWRSCWNFCCRSLCMVVHFLSLLSLFCLTN